MPAALKNGKLTVFIPYAGSESADTALNDLRRAGLPQGLEALVAVTEVWLPLSPYEITSAVSARRMKLLASGACAQCASDDALRAWVETSKRVAVEAVRLNSGKVGRVLAS